MSATGIGLSATAAPLASEKFQIVRFAASSRMRTLWVTISSCRSPARSSVLRATRAFPSRSSTSRIRSFKGSIKGAGRSHWIVVVPLGSWILTSIGVGPRGRHHDVGRLDQAADPLVLDLGVDLVAVGVGIAVDLVENEDDRLLGLAEPARAPRSRRAACRWRRRRGSGPRAARRPAPGSRGPRRRPRRCPAYRSARAWPLRARGGPGSLAPSAVATRMAVVPWVVPTLKTSWPSKALRTDDLPRLTMPKAAISIVFRSSFSVKVAELLELVTQGGLFLGGEVEALKRILQALTCLLDDRRVSWRSVGPVRRAIRSAPRRRSWYRSFMVARFGWCFRTSRPPISGVVICRVMPDELDREGQSVHSRGDRE